MANVIKVKQSSVPGKAPTVNQIDLGELAVNTYDGKLYLKKNVAGTESVVEIGTGGGGGSGDVVGPSSATADGVVLFNGTTGKLIKDSGKAVPGGDLVGSSDSQTLTNKRVTPRIGTTASNATITPTADSNDQYNVTALAVDSAIATPSGTPTDGQRLLLRIKDDGTGRALTWTTSAGGYRAIGVTLPTTTVVSKVLYVGCLWNAQDSYWDVTAVAQEQ